MKEERRIIDLDKYEEGAVITALNDLRNDNIEEKKSTDVVDSLLIKIFHAPTKKVRVRNEER